MNRRSFFKRMFCGVAAAIGLPLAAKADKSKPEQSFCFEFDPIYDGKVVSVIEFQGRIIVTTERRIWEFDRVEGRLRGQVSRIANTEAYSNEYKASAVYEVGMKPSDIRIFSEIGKKVFDSNS